ncbi:MAG TPA: hypothetical protein VFU14_20245 [Acidimicrobiales bacterium]|nr:hypothetical protein [Acidimicrobiales bacterium]
MSRTGSLAVAMAVLVGACGSNDSGDGPRLAEAATTTTDGATTTTTEATTTTSAAIEFVIGDRVETSRGNLLQVHGYEQPVASGNEFIEPDPGHEFAVVDVENCVGPDTESDLPLPVSSFDYVLQMPDNTRREPAVTSPAREPTFRTAQLFAPGECYRGFITFEIPIGQRPAFVIDTATAPPVRWAVD